MKIQRHFYFHFENWSASIYRPFNKDAYLKTNFLFLNQSIDVVVSQKNPLDKMILLSTKQMFKLENEMIFTTLHLKVLFMKTFDINCHCFLFERV